MEGCGQTFPGSLHLSNDSCKLMRQEATLMFVQHCFFLRQLLNLRLYELLRSPDHRINSSAFVDAHILALYKPDAAIKGGAPPSSVPDGH